MNTLETTCGHSSRAAGVETSSTQRAVMLCAALAACGLAAFSHTELVKPAFRVLRLRSYLVPLTITLLCWGGLFILRRTSDGNARAAHRCLSWCVVMSFAFTLSLALHRFPYLGKFFVFFTFAICAALMQRRNTRDLAAWITTVRPLRHARPSLVMALASLLAVGLVEAFRGAIAGVPDRVVPALSPTAFGLNAIVLLCAAAIVFMVTNRAAFSGCVAIALYLLLATSDLVKVRYMHTNLTPLDFVCVPELVPYLRSFLTVRMAVALAVSSGLFVSSLILVWRRSSYRAAMSRRSINACCLVAFVASIAWAYRFEPVQRLLRGAGVDIRWDRHMAGSTRHGFLLDLLFEVPGSFVRAPSGYCERAVAECARRYRTEAGSRNGQAIASDCPDLVIVQIESFMDPDDLHIAYSLDPIPTFRKAARQHTSGRAIVPGAFGGTGETEFEVLTGLSKKFLPRQSCAYKQYIKHDMPSLPRLLQSHGYRSIAVYPDHVTLYSRGQVCPHLGFDEVTWLGGMRSVPLDIAGRGPSDDAVVDAIIGKVGDGAPPMFVFAATTASHFPYNDARLRDLQISVVGAIGEDSRDEVSIYVNEIRIADRAIERLLDHFSASKRKTVIVVLGDHLPPLAAAKRAHFVDPDAPHAVPLLIWSNYLTKREDVRMGTNFLGSYVLSLMGLRPSGFWALNDTFRSRITAFTPRAVLAADGRRFAPGQVPEDYRKLVEDYWLIEYDLLLGKQFTLRYLPEPQSVQTAKSRQ